MTQKTQTNRRIPRRRFLQGIGGAALALPFYELLRRRGDNRALAAPSGGARRVIFFYFPDGVAGPSQDGSPSLWHPTGSETGFTLTEQLTPLSALRGECVFLSGLTSGPTDSGSHPGGAKKLLTAADGGDGESIDQLLARTAGADAPFRHLYLGAMANQNNASGDKHISYPRPGTTIPPEDDPRRAFARLFMGRGMTGGTRDELQVSVIDTALADLSDLRGRLGDAEKAKLDLHLEALREVEKRVKAVPGSGGAGCDDPRLDTGGITDAALYDPKIFPVVLRAQTDLMVQAMACGLTRVGVLQCSQHTSELIMSRFPGTEMYDPGFDMRSHQASHYGPKHDRGNRLFRDFLSQRRWFVAQFAYLLEQLKARPESNGDGTMLDHSLVLLCSEVCDGNTHSHDNLPFVLSGRGGGKVRTGRLLQYGNRRHADLLLSIAQAMGQSINHFGQGSSGPLPGLLG